MPRRKPAPPIAAGKLSEADRDLIKHALTGGTRSVYRNYYASGLIGAEYDRCSQLMQWQMLTRQNTPAWTQGLAYWTVTELGAACVGLYLPGRKPKPTQKELEP